MRVVERDTAKRVPKHPQPTIAGVGSSPRQSTARARRSGSRAKTAAEVIGPVGHLFGSPIAARILDVIIREPATRFALKDLVKTLRLSKGAALVAIHSLENARLVTRVGEGPKTSYQYDLDSPVGGAMLQAVKASQALASESDESDIPWLAEYAAQPGGRLKVYHAGRTEPDVSDEVVERVLSSAEPIEESKRPRTRSGFRTRG